MRKILILLVLSLLHWNTQAQDTLKFKPKKDSLPAKFEPEMALGAKGIFSLSRVNFAPAVPQSFLMDYGGGVVFKYASQRSLGIQWELNYAVKGWKENWSNPDQRYSRKLYYLEMPFMTNIFAGKRTAFFVFNFGPVLSYLLRSQRYYYNASPEQLEYYNDDIRNRVELGICGGIGLLIKTPGGHIQLEGRYAHNFLNFFDDTVFSTSQNQSITASLAYLWAFNPKAKGSKTKEPKPEKTPKTKGKEENTVPSDEKSRLGTKGKENNNTTPPPTQKSRTGTNNNQ